MMNSNKKRKPFCLIAGEFPWDLEKRNGGLETVTYNTAMAIKKTKKMDVGVVTLVPGLRNHRHKNVNGFWVTYLPAKKMPKSISMFTSDYYRLKSFIKKLKPEIIHTHSQDRYSYAAVRSGIPSVMSVHGLFLKESRLITGHFPIKFLRRFLWKQMERYNLRRFSHLIVMNDYVENIVNNFSKARIHRIQNPIDDTYFKNENCVEKGHILYAGMISPRKDLETLLNAASIVTTKNPGIHFYIAGKICNENYFNLLVNTAKNLNIQDKITFLGFITENELINEYGKCELFILTSREDTSPMAIGQAMALGKPVVASRVGGIPYLVVHGENGFTYEPGNHSAMAEAILKILENPELRKDMSRRAKIKAELELSYSEVGNKLLRIYESVMEDLTQ